VFKNFYAEVILYETPEVEILPSQRDHSLFLSIDNLVDDVNLYGYYGGIRLLKAAVKRFRDYCTENKISLHGRNFTLRYRSTIPHRVGLAGSSAIITACMRCLLEFYEVEIPKPMLANLILAVENEELGITAGLQDRVAQVYQGMVYMNFDKEIMEAQGYGEYIPIDYSRLPPLFIAYRDDLSEGSEIFHNDIRHRFNKGDTEVVAAMKSWAGLTDKLLTAIDKQNVSGIGRLIDRNFNLRRTLYRISKKNIQMVQAARSAGASAKFSGSGGAIVGTYTDITMYERLKQTLKNMGIKVIKPVIVPASKG
jgi:glucuronokinase